LVVSVQVSFVNEAEPSREAAQPGNQRLRRQRPTGTVSGVAEAVSRRTPESLGNSTTARARQKIQPIAMKASASPPPNSPVSHFVGPVSTVTRSKNACTNRLCDACRIAAGQTLPERSLSHANGKPIATTMMPKQSTEYHGGVPPL